MEDFVLRTCCFTGHRPNKFPWGYDESDPRCIHYKQQLRDIIVNLYKDGINWFIVGGAVGFDTWAAEIIIDLKKEHKDIILEVAIPCRTQDSLWPKKSKDRYKNIIDNAQKLTIISHEYTDSCMQQRNEYMLKKSSVVVAGIIEGVRGGTFNTIKKARALNKKIIVVGEKEKQEEWRFYIEEQGKLFPFSLSLEQLNNIEKAKKDKK